MKSFDITNGHKCKMCLVMEPEGIEFIMEPETRVTIIPKENCPSINVRFAPDPEGMLCVFLWPEEGEYDIFRNGQNILNEL
jgi:hypothetical protein